MQHHISSRSPVAALVAGAAAGDQAAWDQLVERYASTLWAIARSFRLCEADAHDAAQATWVRLMHALPRIRRPECLGAWLATTMRRQCLVVLRAKGRDLPSDEIAETAGADPEPIDGHLLRTERDALLERALRRLAVRDQALLRLVSAEPPIPYREIAAALDMRVGSIGPTRERALGRLRLALGDAEKEALAGPLEPVAAHPALA